MSGDDEDFVFYGTPIEREEEIRSRRKKAVAEASGQLRTLPPWKQEASVLILFYFRQNIIQLNPTLLGLASSLVPNRASCCCCIDEKVV